MHGTLSTDSARDLRVPRIGHLTVIATTARQLLSTTAVVFLALGLIACDGDIATPESSTNVDRPPDSSRRRGSPNLIVITLDTTRADSLGIYGSERPTSPTIDRMARSGTWFENALTSSPMTLPSHSTIFTGQQPYVHGIRSNVGYVLSNSAVTLAEILRGRGYRTAAEVAVDVLRKETGLDQGFDVYRTPADPNVQLKSVVLEASGERRGRPIRAGADITAKGVEFIRANRERRFFLWLHYFDAHLPHVLSAEHRARIPDSSYHAAVYAQDDFVGRVIQEIERLGLRDDTVVILTADHGEGLGEHDEETHSYFVYDTTMRVPLVFWGIPEIERGRRHDGVVRTVDITPTALELLGLTAPDGLQGTSVAPLITGKSKEADLVAYGESFEGAAFFELSPIRFVREGRWKYIHKVNPELYDIEADPNELRNLAAQNPEKVSQLRARLEELLRAAPAKLGDSTTTIDPAMQAQLQALGYLSSTVTPADFDEVASLDVSGDDPNTRIGTVDALARSVGMIQSELYEEAEQTLLPILEEYPESTFVLSRLAESAVGRDRIETAIDYYERVLAIDACEERSLSVLNKLYKRVTDYDALIETLGRGAENCPDYSVNLNNYAWARATLPRDDLRDGNLAIDVARLAIAANGARSPELLDTLAVALAEAGRFEEAIDIQLEALDSTGEHDTPAEVVTALRTHLEAFGRREPIRSPDPNESS